MSEWMIEVDEVSRKFGRQTVLDGVNLRVKRGSIYGFLGRNGAGKTTLIKIIAGLLRPDQGHAKVMGLEPFSLTAESRQNIGYLSEKQILPATLKVKDLIRFTAQFYPQWDQPLVDRLIESFSINRDKSVYQLSQGGQRQLGFILALAQRPDLLILDEPASTLDVVARREFLDELLSLAREQGSTVFFSTHILSDVERVADEIGILAHGKTQISEPLDKLKESIKQVRFFRSDGSALRFEVPGTFRRQEARGELVVTMRVESGDQLSAIAQSNGCQWEIRPLNLEDIFVEISRK